MMRWLKKVSAAHKKESEVKDMVAFKYKQISNSRQIGGTRPKSNIKFIVIHYTGNPGKGANADAHYRYLQGATRYGSAHYFVDDHEIIQVIGDNQTAWACGDNQGYGTALNGCTNHSSISIEMCVNSDGDFNKTLFNTIELTKELLRLYPQANVCRHYDVSRKSCPAMMAGPNNPKWNSFLEEIKKPRQLILDLSKDSVGKPIGGNIKTSENEKSDGWKKENNHWYFYGENGKRLTGWLKDKGQWFYLQPDKQGQMLEGWLEYNKNWYYFKSGGYMVKGWLEYNKNKFYFNPETGKMVTGKQIIDNKEYTFNKDGYFIK